MMPAITPLVPRSALRQAITAAWISPEPDVVPRLVEAARVPPDMAGRIQALARRITQGLREHRHPVGRSGLVQGLLQEFSLSSQEGVALMCLAEALLRIPDTATRDALIRDKIRDGNWKAHLGRAPSLFVNAAAWGLMLTGKLVATHSETGMSAALGRLVAKGGEPLVRKGVDTAMRMMGEQFVTGQTIKEALDNARNLEARGFRYSYDMLGEAAMTAADAARYLADYEAAIHAIGKAASGRGVYEGAGISIKLSALHPRYSRAQMGRVWDELYPRLLGLARLARHYDIGLNIDAEEADRLELSIDLLERLCFEPELRGWHGVGFVIQAYQKRCPDIVDYLIDLADRSERRLMVRLVKGAYWDTEIKRAQVDGLVGYPVYTRKAYTDVAYVACARKLLAARAQIYPQFATHNAQTLASVYELAGPDAWFPGQYEFQCLHGMGEALYEQVVGDERGKLGRPCRIYAPVGTHETLLAYLVRRLLENGANTSFVNRVGDESVSIDELIENPIRTIEQLGEREGVAGAPHPRIPLPPDLYHPFRRNARGLNLSNEDVLASLDEYAHPSAEALAQQVLTGPVFAAVVGDDAECRSEREQNLLSSDAGWVSVLNPAQHEDVVGRVCYASEEQIEISLQRAHAAASEWAQEPVSSRAACLKRAADSMEAGMESLLGLIVREAGKTYPSAVAEVREAVDFLRYYAAQVETTFDNASHRPLGVVVCISPWNFPLAIFTGQVAAALAAGNTVLAKPAEQTTLIAAHAVRLLHESGVSAHAVQLVAGKGSVAGPLLVGDPRVDGVMFTGSTDVAKTLQVTLAQRLGRDGKPVPLVAETGGQNAMVVDSSALPEQVVRDVLASAFDSAGQRCSALRVLCIQQEVANPILVMLKGAMGELSMGDPAQLHNDVGPVIDEPARARILEHIAAMAAKGRRVHRLCHACQPSLSTINLNGTYVEPTLIEIESINELKREVFGPVLHVLRYRRDNLDSLLDQIRATGFGLTMGLHTRIDETIRQVVRGASVGNLYVNRNMVGAVVGVQPFGGEGFSGTGPKAGGPLYLYRLLASRPDTALAQPFGMLSSQALAPDEASSLQAHSALLEWSRTRNKQIFPTMPAFFNGDVHTLPGPTGESNTYQVKGRDVILCIADTEPALLTLLESVFRVGAQAAFDASSPVAVALHGSLPTELSARIALIPDLLSARYDAALHWGDSPSLKQLTHVLARRDGPIVPLTAVLSQNETVPLERLVIERTLSIDTTAAGGNASLMTLH